MKKILFIAGVLLLVVVGVIYFNDDSKNIYADIDFADDYQPAKEKEQIEDMISSLDDILLLDMETDEKYNNSSALLIKDGISSERHTGMLARISSLRPNEGDSEIFYSMEVDDSGKTKKDKMEEADRTFTTSDGVKVYLLEDEESKNAYFEFDNLYYEVTAKPDVSSDKEATWDGLEKAVNEMHKGSPLVKTFKNRLHKRIEENFVMPDYFPANIELSSITIDRHKVELFYGGALDVKGSDSKDKTGLSDRLHTYINYVISDQEFRFDESNGEEIELENNIKANLMVGYDKPEESSKHKRQNAIFFENDNLYYKIHTTNIEKPINNEDADNLLKIVNSLDMGK